jgi:hypothetical protein
MHTATAIHNPWRTVLRRSRTECRILPRSLASIGDVAIISPRPKIIGAK